MQFLVITKPANPAPPMVVVPLIGAMEAWVARHRASGTMTSVWSFAGTAGGGGVIDVDSHEELASIMAGFPFAPFSPVEIIALSDVDQALATAKVNAQEVVASMGQP